MNQGNHHLKDLGVVQLTDGAFDEIHSHDNLSVLTSVAFSGRMRPGSGS